MIPPPLFSVVIPLYNKEKHIKTTIESVLNQSFTDFEVIIVNDGSTDGSDAIVKSFSDSRIKIYTTKNQGVSTSRNFGIEKALGEFIAFLDADDIWLANHLSEIKTLHNLYPNCGLFGTSYDIKTGHKTLKPIFKNISKDANWKGIVRDYFECSSINCIAWTSAVMVPRKILLEMNGFDSKITMGAGEDTDLWIRIALNYPVAFSNISTAIYQINTGYNISDSNTNLRNFIDLDQYEEIAKTNKSLKIYLDLNRYSIAKLYLLSNNIEKHKLYISKIDFLNLNFKQKLLLKLPRKLLFAAIKVKKMVSKKGFNLTSFN